MFDNEPSNRDPPAFSLHRIPGLKRPEQHDGAGNREGEAEDQSGQYGPAQIASQQEPQKRRDSYLRKRSWQGNFADRKQVLQRKMKANAKHQQDYADFREFYREIGIRHESRSEWAYKDAGKQITCDRRHAETIRKGPHSKSNDQSSDDRCYERRMMRHGRQ